MSKNNPPDLSKKINMNSINAHEISQRLMQGLTSKIISKENITNRKIYRKK